MWSNQIKFSKMGNGSVVHISRVHIFDGGVTDLRETLCVTDPRARNNNGSVKNSLVRPVAVEQATCKRCLKIRQSDEAHGVTYTETN